MWKIADCQQDQLPDLSKCIYLKIRTPFCIVFWHCFENSFISFSIVHAQCNFQPPFNGTSWHDNTKGTLTFGTQYMTGWTFYPFKQTVNQWQCINSVIDNVLVMRQVHSN